MLKLSYIIICQLWLRTCVAWKSRGRDFRWCEVRIYINGCEAPAEREARERAKWNERSPLVSFEIVVIGLAWVSSYLSSTLLPLAQDIPWLLGIDLIGFRVFTFLENITLCILPFGLN